MDDEWPAEDLERVDACPACGSPARTPLHQGVPDGNFGIAPGTWAFVRCSACCSDYLDPRPTEASIGRAYAGAYVTHDAPSGLEPPPIGALARARRAMRNGWVRRNLGYRLGPASPTGALVPLVPPLRAMIDRDFRHVRLPRPGARLLDVGCGNGAFVRKMRQAGWDAVGQDIDVAALGVARVHGVPIYAGPLKTLAEREPGAFDAVTLSHVIEHVHDPPAFMALCHRLLVPGGQVWIATPNASSTGHRRFGTAWTSLDPPRHLTLFTAASLSAMLERAGFTAVALPLPWAHGGHVLQRSLALRAGVTPDPAKTGSMRSDLVGIVRPRRAEELVAVALRA